MFQKHKAASYMEALDAWTESTIVEPLFQAAEETLKSGSEQGYRTAAAEIKKAIRQKTLESYRNGQAAGPSTKKAGGHHG